MDLEVEKRDKEVTKGDGKEIEEERTDGSPISSGQNPQIKRKRSKNRSKKKNKRLTDQSTSNAMSFPLKRPLSSPEEGAGTSTVSVKKVKSNEQLKAAATPTGRQNQQGMCQQKKPIIRDVVLLTRMAIIPFNYPECTFSEEAVTEMEKQLLQLIDDNDDETEALTFQYRRYERGFFKVACIGEFTCRWLMETTKEWKFNGIPIKVIPLKDLPKSPEYRSWISENVMPPEKILYRLGRQNKGLIIGGVKHKRSVEAQTGFLAYFELDTAAVEYIKARNYLLFFGLTQIKLTLASQSGGNTVDNGKVTAARNDDDPNKIGTVNAAQQ